MKKRTSINLELALVEQAKDVLGTTETTETIHRALSEVVRRSRLERLARRRFDVSNADLAELRRPRTDNGERISVRTKASV